MANVGRPKGLPRTGGRQPGTPNKVTTTVRAAFERAFNILQQDDKAKLETWAKENQTDFYKLSSKLIPIDMAVHGQMVLNVVTGVPVDDPDITDDSESDLNGVDVSELC